MKALSIRQPWAWLIVAGYKRVENRTWRTGYRGPLAIHAGQAFDLDGYLWVLRAFPAIEMPHPDSFPRGKILGTAVLSDIVTESADPWFCGPYGWVLRAPRMLMEQLPRRGRLGLFDVDWEGLE
jgi:hypothetical protein